MNNTLKSHTNFKAQELRQFVDKHQAQENLVKKAVLQTDRWRFRDEYSHLQVDSDKWFSMSKKMQMAHLNRVYSEPLGPAIIFSSSQSPSTTASTSASTSSDELSFIYKNIINTSRVSTDTLKDIWTKAGCLTDTPGLVCKVPGQDGSDNRMVVSNTGNEPHYISRKPRGQFVCSGICPRFTAYKICEHIVAACEHSGNLKIFCDWWKCLKSGPNLDSLALSGLPKGVAGNKGGTPTRSRRGRKKIISSVTVHD